MANTDAADPNADLPSFLSERVQDLEARNAQLLDELRKAESERRFVEGELIRLQKEIKRLRVELDRLKTPPLIGTSSRTGASSCGRPPGRTSSCSPRTSSTARSSPSARASR